VRPSSSRSRIVVQRALERGVADDPRQRVARYDSRPANRPVVEIREQPDRNVGRVKLGAECLFVGWAVVVAESLTPA